MDEMMLIIDDVEINRAILKVLFSEKYEIMEAESAEEGLAILKGCQGSIDIVLLDLMMPGMSGFDMLKEKADLDYFRDVPVIVITSSENHDDQVRAFDLGANDFIPKPFIPEVVISRVNNVMSSNRRMVSIEMEAQEFKIKAQRDEMTGLYNKSTAELLMDRTLKSSEGSLQVMMIIDTDNFKTVNDTMGHQAGDKVIVSIANLISRLFRKADIIGRVGGDEFCVLMTDVPNMNIAYSKVNELIQIMKYKPDMDIPDYVTLSVGLAANGKKNTSYGNLFKKADAALYNAKQAGKSRFCEYGVEGSGRNAETTAFALLISSNRSVCSVVHSLVPADVKILEVLRPQDVEIVEPAYRDKLSLIYVDVSEAEDDASDSWAKLKNSDWIEMENVFAICKEGNAAQYMTALNSGAADLILTPVDSESFKRRTEKHLSQKTS